MSVVLSTLILLTPFFFEKGEWFSDKTIDDIRSDYNYSKELDNDKEKDDYEIEF